MFYKYNYNVISADLNYHIAKHPQQNMKDHGYQWVWSEAHPIADCWLFFTDCEIKDAPSYITFIRSANTLEELSDVYKSWKERTENE